LGQAHNDASAGMIPALQSGMRQLPAEHSGEQDIDEATQAAILESIDVDIVGFGAMDLVDVSRAQVSAPLIVNLPREEGTEDTESDTIAMVSESAVPANSANTANSTEFAVLEALPATETTAKTEATTDATIPAIEWELPASVTDATPSKAQSDKSGGVGNWLKDFLQLSRQ
ncbi:MAG: hypothetical protein PVJ72_09765, partial [Gammaproteobacteria bacterium]